MFFFFQYFIVTVPSFDSNIRLVYFRTKGLPARVNFLAIFFCIFVAQIARTPTMYLVFVNITKDEPSQRKTLSYIRT